ncbi:MAG: RIP metalloprotease RseP [Spirochaetota bacterium]|nr:RIP metalloprotease RseP [Spirochaetota bacterium]
MFFTIFIFILILGLFIFVHEFGHFIVAKKMGVKVEEFGFGFPPRIFGIKRGETIYSLNWIPLGGFVKIYGEDGLEVTSQKLTEKELKGRAFYEKSIGQRAMIIIAGVTMNVLSAAVFLSIGYMIGQPTAVDENELLRYPNAKVQILAVSKDSPAEEVGIKRGDEILTVKLPSSENIEIQKRSQFQDLIDEYKGEKISLTLSRAGKLLYVTTIPRENPPSGEGPLGIQLENVTIIAYPFHKAIWEGLKETARLLIFILFAIGEIFRKLFVTGEVAVDVAGPVGIVAITGEVARLGFLYLLRLIALISINLAIVNLLPIPALDGGRLLFLLIEKIKGSPVNQKIERMAHTIGFVLLIILMILITFRDVAKLF